MSTLEIKWLERKEKLMEVTVLDVVTGNETDAVIWATDSKTNTPFPNYASLMPGMRIEGNLWTNPTNGKRTIYPIREGEKKGGGNVAKAMERKEASIEKSQDRKESSIESAATARDATLLTVEWARQHSVMDSLPLSSDELKKKWQEFRDFLRKNFNPDVPFN